MTKVVVCCKQYLVLLFILIVGIVYFFYVTRAFSFFLWPQITCILHGPTFKGSSAKHLDPKGAPAHACEFRANEFNEKDFPRFTWYKNERKYERSAKGKELLLKIWQNQFCHPFRCKKRTLDLPSRVDHSGIGHRLIQEAHTLQTAIANNRILRVAFGGWYYCDKSICPAESSVCYFEPVHNCSNITSEDALAERNLIKDFLVNIAGSREHLWLWGNYNFKDSLWPCLESSPLSGYEDNRFYHSALATYFMSQPQRWLLDEVENTRRTLGLTKDYIAMHVRHGDKWKEMALVSFDRYMAIVMKNYPKNTTVLIMTSDQQVIDDTVLYPDYQFVWTDYPRYYATSPDCETTDPEKRAKLGCKELNIPHLITSGELNGHKEMVNAMVNFYLAVDSVGLICTLGSNFPRTIMRFRLGAYDDMMPVWSLQDWSRDVGIEKLPRDLIKYITFVPPLPKPFDPSKISLAEFMTGF